MNDNAESRKFEGRELTTLSDIQEALNAINLDVYYGTITKAESVSLRKRAGERLRRITHSFTKLRRRSVEPGAF